MTQPSTSPAPPPAAPPAPTNTPPTNTPPTDPGQPTGAPPVVPGWPPQAPPGYPAPQASPVQYVPVMPIPPTLAPPAAPENGTEGGETDLAKLPQWAQRQIQTLRDENAKRRVSERGAVVNQHAWMAAQQLGANASAVLGSLAWQQAAEGLDPTSPDFGRRLAEAIHRTVTANPWMAAATPAYPQSAHGQQPPSPGQTAPPGQPSAGAPGPGQPPAPPGWPSYPGLPPGYPPPGYPQPGWPGYPLQPPAAPPTSGAEFAGGNNPGAPITEAQLAQMSPDQIVEALNNGKLKHLL